MLIRNLLVLGVVAVLISGCQSWRPDTMPPTATLPDTSETGVVEVRYWDNVSGSSVSNLTSIAAYPDNPDEVAELTELRGPTDRGDTYGSLVRGFIIPPTDGSYRFYVTGDNETQFWLSSDESPENAEMVALMPGAAGPNEYDRYNSQASNAIDLKASTRYYFEIIHKERIGGDHFNVAWEGPGISRQIIGSDAIASLGKSPYDSGEDVSGEDIVEAYNLGYRVGFFDGTQDMPFNSEYPPKDMDQDGLYDNWEVFYGLDPNNPSDSQSDSDDDVLSALDEFWFGTDPTNTDTDGDGIPDAVEFAAELNPLDPSDASRDLDGDGATNLEEYQAGTDMSDANDVPAITEPSPDQGMVSGFVGQYYSGTSFNRFVMTRNDGTISFNWGRAAPGPGMPDDNFSVRWSGLFTAPHATGDRDYLFTTVTNDGVRLYLNNELTIQQWKAQGPTAYTTVITLDAGETVPVSMEYYEGSRSASAELSITDLSNDREVAVLETVSAPDPDVFGAVDSDQDGIPDSWELAYGLDPFMSDASDTVNSSGVSNLSAYEQSLNPWTLETADTGTIAPPPPPEPDGSTDEAAGAVTLTWTAPLTRLDGSSISLSEIQSYEVVYGQDMNAMDQTEAVEGSATRATISGLDTGTWYFAVRTIDNSNRASPLSETVEFTVE